MIRGDEFVQVFIVLWRDTVLLYKSISNPSALCPSDEVPMYYYSFKLKVRN